ncbi:MAG: hypothetical protein EU530_10425 [Promethearchaeota archaeon]|nr:MAG: hypothetical protein EU530_10425 [Candidatus Lokiarchaeota archaeon]
MANGSKKNRAKLQVPIYIGLWIPYYLCSIAPSIILGGIYYFHILYRIFTVSIQFTVENSLIFFTSPLVLLALYIFNLFCFASMSKLYYWMFNKIHPHKELINALPRGDTAKDVQIYWTRNFFLRLIKWKFTKCPFPWLVNWMFNYVGSTKIGKGTVIDKGGYICQEYLELGENCYTGPMSGQSSHVNEGIYGGFTLKKIKMGNNSVLCTRCMLAPGVEVGENTQIITMSGVTKFSKLKPNSSYYGLPAGKISDKRFNKYIQLPEELIEKKKEIRQ